MRNQKSLTELLRKKTVGAWELSRISGIPYEVVERFWKSESEGHLVDENTLCEWIVDYRDNKRTPQSAWVVDSDRVLEAELAKEDERDGANFCLFYKTLFESGIPFEITISKATEGFSTKVSVELGEILGLEVVAGKWKRKT